jgi:membrane peptidoglycan carboxypeptidase
VLKKPEDWWCSSDGSIPIGNGVSVTPLQMLLAYNTIANGGVYVEPRLVQATIDGAGVKTTPPMTEGRRAVSQATADKMNVMLRSVVQEGTGTAARIDGYTSAGKTGTARKPQGGGYADADGVTHYMATFAGFVPAEAPALSVIVVIDDPTREGIFGGVVAAPAFSKIGEAALRQFAVPPPDTDLAAGAGATARPSGAPGLSPGALTDNGQSQSVVRTDDGRVRAPTAGVSAPTVAAAAVSPGPATIGAPTTTGATSGRSPPTAAHSAASATTTTTTVARSSKKP